MEVNNLKNNQIQNTSQQIDTKLNLDVSNIDSKSPNSNQSSPTNNMIPFRPDQSSRPSHIILRKGSNFRNNTTSTITTTSTSTTTISSSPSQLLLTSSSLSSAPSPSTSPPSSNSLIDLTTNTNSSQHQSKGYLLTHISIKSLLNLHNLSPEINLNEVFTSIYENRIVLTSSLNLGLKMILNINN